MANRVVTNVTTEEATTRKSGGMTYGAWLDGAGFNTTGSRIQVGDIVMDTNSGAPNWYFQLLRWVVFLGFLYGSYNMHSLKNIGLGLLLLVLALLYNPFFQFFISRENWIFLDIVSIFTSISIIVYTKYLYVRS